MTDQQQKALEEFTATVQEHVAILNGERKAMRKVIHRGHWKFLVAAVLMTAPMYIMLYWDFI